MDNTYFADAIYSFIRKGSIPYHKMFSELVNLPEKYSGIDIDCNCDTCSYEEYMRYAAGEIDKLETPTVMATAADLEVSDESTTEFLKTLLGYYMWTHPEILDRWYFIDQYNTLLVEMSRQPKTFAEMMKAVGPEMIRVMVSKNILISVRKNRVMYYVLTPQAQRDIIAFSTGAAGDGSGSGGDGGNCDCPDLEELLGWGSV